MDKDTLRAEIKLKRKNLTKTEIQEKSDKVYNLLFSSGLLESANTVMVYLSAFNEVRTDKIIAKLLATGKRVVAPVTDETAVSITPYYITDISELTKGAYGIFEPPQAEKAKISDIDAVIVPGIAFDKKGNRMGFGAGYYDRFLADFKGIKIGICYNFQLLDEICADTHDIPMDYIISEENIYAV